MLEKDVKISGRKADAKLVAAAAKLAAAEFKTGAGYAIKYEVDENLPPSRFVVFISEYLCSASRTGLTKLPASY